MKITVSANGEVSFETEDVAQAMEMVKGLRNGVTHPTPQKRSPKRKPRPELVEEVPLSAPLMETWRYIVDHGSSSGTSLQEVANGLGVKIPTASYRLRALVKKGLAHNTMLGSYAPGEGEAWSDQPPAD